jgi:cytochrome oxidase assembly protein ShyY1
VLRVHQALTILVGLVLAGVMVLLGLWQLDVYHAQGQAQASQRASQPPVEIGTVARAGEAIADGYGRPVTLTGRYLPHVQVLVPLESQPGAYRVVSALRLADGDVVPVVRGVVTGLRPPPPPRGEETESGLLLPSEEAPAGDLPAGQLSSVRIPTLAQQWPGPLLSGYVTLTAADAAAQGLAPAAVELPQASGRLRNAAYALQWWVFAAFALGLAIRMAQDQELGSDEVGDLTAEEPVEAT